MTRYGMIENRFGEYITYEDHEKELEELSKEKDFEIAELANQIEKLEEEVENLKERLGI